jgi:hypothetical protein
MHRHHHLARLENLLKNSPSNVKKKYASRKKNMRKIFDGCNRHLLEAVGRHADRGAVADVEAERLVGAVLQETDAAARFRDQVDVDDGGYLGSILLISFGHKKVGTYLTVIFSHKSILKFS